MENTSISKRSVAFGFALAVACAVNAIIVVAKEKSDPLMGVMKRLTGHHWTTHSLIVVVVFFGLGALLAKCGRATKMTTNRLIGTLLAAVGAATLIIIGFYLFID